MATVRIVIQGKVQGVFYRVTAKEKADELSIKGWIKNTDEGNVEVMAIGTDFALKKFIKWCHQGPPNAVVENIVVTKKEEEEGVEEFKILKGKK